MQSSWIIGDKLTLLVCGLMLATSGCCIKTCKNNGEDAVHSASCKYHYRTFPDVKTRDEARSSCEDIEAATIAPPSNNSEQLQLYATYIGGSDTPICEDIWTELHYDHTSNQVRFVDGSVLHVKFFTWASGSPPNKSEPCLAARLRSKDKFFLLPKNCESRLSFTCISVNATEMCDAGEVAMPIYADSCSIMCKNGTVTSTSNPTTQTTIISHSTNPPSFFTTNNGEDAGQPSSCMYHYRTLGNGKTRDEARSICEDIEAAKIAPPSNNIAQLLLYATYIGGSKNAICEDIWTGLHYGVFFYHTNNQVRFVDESVLHDTFFKWASGSPPKKSESCLAARSSSKDEFILLPKNCENRLSFICISVNATEKCGAEEVAMPMFADSCSIMCKNGTMLSTTNPTTQTTITSHSTTSPSSFTPSTTHDTDDTVPPLVAIFGISVLGALVGILILVLVCLLRSHLNSAGKYPINDA